MKKQKASRKRQKQYAPNLVPTFEECLTFVMGELSHSRSSGTKATLTPTERHRFNQMERKANLLDLDEYRDILRRVLIPGFHDLTPESGELVRMLEDELRMFLRRYEILNWQIVPCRATKPQVLWSLSHRFLVPWIALRIAFRLPADSAIGGDVDDWWFLPLRDKAPYSCVMKVIDQFVRKAGESNASLMKRLCRIEQREDTSLPAISERAQKESAAQHFEDNISKYSHFKTSPSNRVVEQIVGSTSSVTHLRMMLVLARFVDRCIRAALKVFGEDLVIELLGYFALIFVELRAVVNTVRAENPTLDPERVWTYLQSLTYMGKTPGKDERFVPLMDQYMNDLARNINAEIQDTNPNQKLTRLPRDIAELNAGRWSWGQSSSIPAEIESALFGGSVSAAVAASQRMFRGRIAITKALATCLRFRIISLATYRALAEGWSPHRTVEDAALAMDEAKRLFHASLGQMAQSRKWFVALDYLEFIIEPYRPKSVDDAAVARKLLNIVTNPLLGRNLEGALLYLEGCLLALEGNDRQAIRAFSKARKCRRESCGRFWIDLLRHALMTAGQIGAKREHKSFAKLVRMIGLFSNDATPRSNELKAQMMEGDFRRVWTGGFKPFPCHA